MSFRVLEDVCIGCGACDFSCPTGALTKTDSFLGLFTIDPFTCNDCAACVPKCPVLAIVPDPAWAVCGERGCPLSSKRLEAVECAFWQDRCPHCGATMWRIDGTWQCSRCDAHMKVACPRTHQLGATNDNASAEQGGSRSSARAESKPGRDHAGSDLAVDFDL